MPATVEPKAIDFEAELNNAQRLFLELAPQCSVEKRAGGIPQLAMQEKQMSILKNEMDETLLNIHLATKGQHAIRDAGVNENIRQSITEFESWNTVLKQERTEEKELDLLNYILQKKLEAISKHLPAADNEQAIIEAASNRLRRMENRLDLAMKRFCVVNADNKQVREEIHRLLVERNNFNIQWNRTIGKLIKGKQYLSEMLEMTSVAFRERDEACTKLHSLKWKGLFRLNKDIAEMQYYDSEINHLAKLEEFLRVKGSKRLCEADELMDVQRQEDIVRCEQEIMEYDSILEQIFKFAGTDRLARIINNFRSNEMENFTKFVYLCDLTQETIFLKTDVNAFKQRILDQHDINLARIQKEERALTQLTEELTAQQQRTKIKQQEYVVAEALIVKVLRGIDELLKLAKCDITPLLCLLGEHQQLTNFNVVKFMNILECEVKSLIQVAYGAVKPPAPTPKAKDKTYPVTTQKIVADPRLEVLRPNTIDRLVPYAPCAYCVEDYIMNFVYETPAVPADEEYIDSIFHLENVNTKFGIYSLTVPTKRHPLRNKNMVE